jgi:hypothetical protein
MYKSETFLYDITKHLDMPLTNNTIIRLNEITMFVSNKRHLKETDEEFIKNTFKNILESGDLYNIDEIESWFALEGSWHDKSAVDRIVNIAHYQQSKHDAKNKLRFAPDECSCH